MTARPAQWRSMAVDKLVCVYVRNDGLKVLPPRQFFTHSSRRRISRQLCTEIKYNCMLFDRDNEIMSMIQLGNTVAFGRQTRSETCLDSSSTML